MTAPVDGRRQRLRHQLATLRGMSTVYRRAAPRPLALRVAVAVGAGLAPVGAAWLTKGLLDRLTGRPGAPVAVLAVTLALVGAVSAVFQHAGQYLDTEITRRVGLHTQAELFAAVARDPGLERLEDPAWHDRVQLAQQSSLAGSALLSTMVLSMGQSLITVSGFAVSLVCLSPLAAGLVALSVVPTLVAQLRLSHLRSTTMLTNSPHIRRQLFYGRLLLDLGAAKEIRLFGLGDFFRDRMLTELGTIQRGNREVDRSTAVVDSVLSLMTAGVSAVVLVVAAVAASNEPGHVGELTLLVAALASVQATLAGLIAQLATVDQALTLFGHFLSVTSSLPAADVRRSARRDVTEPAPLLGAIRFEGVWFRYGPEQPWVLRDLDLTVEQGTSLALVGLNGAGKSTIVKLLCRLYEPTRGRITWDGQDVRTFDIDTLRARIGTVFQDHVAYDLSAMDNIALGDLDSIGDDARIVSAASHAGIHDVLATLPNGYATMLTRTFAPDDSGSGTVLSGGQWQRVALARALLRANADLLILDEPSSGLDAQAEHEVHQTLRGLRTGSTTLLVSHRLNTVREADRVAVLSHGRVAECGNHDELMHLDGTYAELFRLQADGYADRDEGVRA